MRMENETKFYDLLIRARYDENALILVIKQIMPLINSYSLRNKKIDEDLRSELIEYAIVLIKDENFADKLANYKKI